MEIGQRVFTNSRIKSGGRTFYLLLALGLGSCVSNAPTGAKSAKLSASEKMMWSTFAVGTRGGMATSFIVGRKDAHAPGGIVPVVVTSVHVLSPARKGPFYLGARVRDGSGKLKVAIVEIQASDSALPGYVRHPRYDIAAFDLRMTPAIAQFLQLSSILNDSDIGQDQPSVGEEVSVLGFPDVFPGTSGAFPVLRAGKVASYSTAVSGEPQRFLINTDVYPGDSGGPVFMISRTGKPKLVGMVTHRVGPDATKAVPLAVAVDSGAIRETLDLLAARSKTPSQARPAISVRSQ